ncbi:histidine kinase [Cryptosporangium sp. NPDC051539]|uniref:histidine kinase n=1 Tax=Cryptosporangium sp. NPDC051539 TaxID=3363962 RepID=UPI0037A5931D
MRVRPKAFAIDVLLAGVLSLVTVGAAFVRPGPVAVLAVVLSLLTSAPIALRQAAPVGVLSVVLGAELALAVLAGSTFPDGGFAVVIAGISVATLCSRRTALVMLGVTCLVLIGCLLITGVNASAALFWSEGIKAFLGVVVAWTIGIGTRRWAERTERLALQAERAALRAERAASNERVRIARELHDVVSHHMSVISLQAGVSRFLLDTDRDATRTALVAVEDSSREALSEMRRLLEVLRPNEDADYRPQPGLAELDGLVERTRAAGVPVAVTVTGRARPLASGPDLCAYRVVQESLTNVIKHAGPADVRIEVDYGENTLTLRVLDDGAGPTTAGKTETAAHGIRGMRERAELYGGVLTAGPREERGFGVVARLPI